MTLSARITPQLIHLFSAFLFAWLALTLWWFDAGGALIYFEFGLVAGLNAAFYFVSRFDKTRAENLRAIEANSEEWRRLAFQGRELLERQHLENVALRQMLSKMGVEIASIEFTEGTVPGEPRIVIEEMEPPDPDAPKPKVH